LISHDRALLDDVCDKFVILDGAGNARVFEGSYRDWEAKQKAEASEAVARAKKAETKKLDTKRTETNGAPKSAAAKPVAPTSASATSSSSGKTSSATHGSSNKSRSKYSNLALEKIEARISEIGRELMAIDFEFADPKTAADSVKTKKLLSRREELGREQSELEEEWMRKSG